MKNFITTLKLLVLTSLIVLFSCGSDSKTEVSVQQEKKVIQQIDSLSTELNKKSTKVEEKTKKMKDDVDKLLDGI